MCQLFTNLFNPLSSSGSQSSRVHIHPIDELPVAQTNAPAGLLFILTASPLIFKSACWDAKQRYAIIILHEFAWHLNLQVKAPGNLRKSDIGLQQRFPGYWHSWKQAEH